MMIPFKFIIFLTTWLTAIFSSLGFAQHLASREKTFYTLLDKSLVENVTLTKKVKSDYELSFLCLRQGPPPWLSFNFGKVTDSEGYYKCELCNSKRYLEPHGMQKRLNYDYYGIITQVRKVSFSLNVTSRHWSSRCKVCSVLFSHRLVFSRTIMLKNYYVRIEWFRFCISAMYDWLKKTRATDFSSNQR